MIGVELVRVRPAIFARPGAGQVYVTTDPALSPPGSIVLDARS